MPQPPTEAVKLWMSGEIQADIGDEFREARKVVEHAVNEGLGTNYGAGFTGWVLIAIIMEHAHPDYGEIKRYRKKDGFELRLKIDHAAFKSASATEQQKLIASIVRRSITEMRTLAAKNVDYDRLQADVSATLESRGWT